MGIQTMAKRKEVQIRNTTMVFRLSRQTYAAGIIQRSFRGMVIRRFAKQARQQKHQHSVLGRYHNPLACTIYEFEQQGAAHRIQSVLRTRPFCLGVIRCLGIQKYCSTILYRVRHWQFHRKLSAYFGSRLQSHKNKRSLKIAAASTIERTMRKCYQQEKIKKNPTTRRVERTRVSVASSAGIVKLDLDTADVRTMCKYKNSQYLNNKGIVHIQSLQRGSHARKHVAALRTQHGTSVQELLRTWLKYQLQRRLQHHISLVMAWIMSSLVLGLSIRSKSATKIIAWWTGFRIRRLHKWKLEGMRLVGLRLNWRVKIFLLCRYTTQATLDSARLAEREFTGRIMFMYSRKTEVQHQILTQSMVRRPNHASELHHLFMTYSSYGQRGNTNRLGVVGFLRLLRETPNVMQPSNKCGLSPSDIELTIMKSRGRSKSVTADNHLQYCEFLNAIVSLADKFVPCKESPGNNLCQFLQYYMFQSKVAACHTKKLGSRSCIGRADAALEAHLRKITSLWRIYHSHSSLNAQRRKLRDHTNEKLTEEMATSIQRVWRGLTARCLVSKFVMGMYDRVVDFDSEQEFWLNRCTKRSLWAKPRIVSRNEIMSPILMPSKELLFVIDCPQCSIFSIEKYCVECGDIYCGKCHKLTHGNDNGHTCMNIELCVQCHFQIGTKFCEQCEDCFCDTCFKDQHSKGSLQKHTYNEIVPHCSRCKIYAARRTGGPFGKC